MNKHINSSDNKPVDIFLADRIYLKLLYLLLISPLVYCVTANGQAKDGEAKVRIVINAVDRMQYDLVRFKVKPDAEVKIVLTNKSEEEHNLIITEPGARQSIVMSALRLGLKGKSMNYIPEKKEVLWTIPLILPGETDSVTFTAPAQSGVYPYVCTVPGHGSIMYGALYVGADITMPDITEDMNIPSVRRKKD